MTAFIDTNILIRHLTGDPPDLAERATAFLGAERELLLTDLVAAETVYVLESFYKAPRDEIAQAMRSMIAFEPIVCVDPASFFGPSRCTRPTASISPRRTSWPVRRAPASAALPPSTSRSIESTRSSGSSRPPL